MAEDDRPAPVTKEPPAKDPAAFRTIREVSELLDVPQHVLRFWETRFPELKPLQRGGNRRYYRQSDVAFASALHKLLHKDGYTVKGVRKLITDYGAQNLVALANGQPVAPRGNRAAAAVPPPIAVVQALPVQAPPAVAVPQGQVGPAQAAAQPGTSAGTVVVPIADLMLLRDRLAAALAA